LRFKGPISPEQPGKIIQLPVAVFRHRASYNIDVVGHRHFQQAVTNVSAKSGQCPNGVGRIFIVEKPHQRCADIFGKKHEIGIIVGDRIDKKLGVFQQFFNTDPVPDLIMLVLGTVLLALLATVPKMSI